MRIRTSTLASVLLCVALAGQACGYALTGRGNSLPSYIKIIGVPQLINQSAIPDIDRVLTNAVQAEFQGKGKYRIQPDTAGVDAQLTGTIVAVTFLPATFTDAQTRQVSSYTIIVTASVEFKDLREDKVLWSNPSFQLRDEYEVTTGTSANDPTANFTQNANAIERLAKTFARSVVTSVFEAF